MRLKSKSLSDQKEMEILRYLILLVSLLLFTTCRKAYDPVIGEDRLTGILVIEGYINLMGVTEIRLSRTGLLQDTLVRNADVGALVYVEGENGERMVASEVDEGLYRTDSVRLDGQTTYRIRVADRLGEEYLSEFVPLLATPAIDSVSWEEQESGVRLMVSTDGSRHGTEYYRWEYVEDYVFYSPFRSNLVFEDHAVRRRRSEEQINRCFRDQRSTDVLIGSSAGQYSAAVRDFILKTIPRDSELLTERYSVLVEQTALTRESYLFWDLLRTNSEDLGDLFGTMPSELVSNIRCTSDAGKQVVGFVEGGSKSQKRIYINNAELAGRWVAQEPAYWGCELQEVMIDEANSPAVVFGGGMLPVDEIWETSLLGYSYANPRCVDCRVRGRVEPPSFWTE